MVEAKGQYCASSGFLDSKGGCRNPDGCSCATIADLERQNAELLEELATANADRCFHTDDDPNCKLESTFMRLVDAAEAENARLKALPLKDEVERFVMKMAEGWANVLELDLIPKQHRMSASILRDDARALLSRLQAGVQEGCICIPTDRLPNRDEGAIAAKIILMCNGHDLDVWTNDEWAHDDLGGLRALAAAPSEQGGYRS